VILPFVGDDAVLGLRVVVPHEVASAGEGRWTLYADPTTGEAVAFETQSFYATGRVLYNVPNRYPSAPRANLPAARMGVTIAGAGARTAADGTVTWSPELPQTLVTSVSGDLVNVVNKASADLATATLTISPGQDVVWNASANATDDAQVTVAIHAHLAKEYVRTFAPSMPTLDAAITTNVNINQTCNASFDGKDLNFYRSSTQCENTGRIADVVYHEFGHAMHFNSLIPGVGRMDGAFSEGLSDFLAVSITEDPGMGRGFFFNDEALRHMDPAGREPRWPDDSGEIHKTGIIFGSAMWDLRKDFITRMGRAAAVPAINRLFYATVQRASDIPTTLVEVLAADDNDGNLANGTPNECSILEQFGRHGLRAFTGVSESPATVVAGPSRKTTVSFTLLGRSPRCASDNVSEVMVEYRPGPRFLPQAGSVRATQGANPDTWIAEIPLPTSDTMTYWANVTLASTVKITIPDSYADSKYQLYEGATMPLMCANMDQNPLTAGFTATPGWAWGAPPATGKFDPRAGFTGNNVLGTVLGGDYAPKATYTLTLPPIDIGKYSDVRLQYRRWLSVEDSQFDKATISANGAVVWTNASEAMGDSSSLHTIDREWRFQDVALSEKIRGSELNLSFGLTTDEGLEFGGWAIDDLCVVVNPSSICGDGTLSGAEQCDNGTANSNKPNACRVDCKTATCGDSVVDKGEECDDGEETDECLATCFSKGGAGCCDAGSNPTAPLVLSLAVVGLLVSRRRRRRAA
jgi:MYXO-CTERM domain-containing protein